MCCLGSRAKPSTSAGGPPARRDPSTHATQGGGLDDGVLVVAGVPARHTAGSRPTRRATAGGVIRGLRRRSGLDGEIVGWVAPGSPMMAAWAGSPTCSSTSAKEPAQRRRGGANRSASSPSLLAPNELDDVARTWRRPRSRRAVPWGTRRWCRATLPRGTPTTTLGAAGTRASQMQDRRHGGFPIRRLAGSRLSTYRDSRYRVTAPRP
jgi:hypothetical protein